MAKAKKILFVAGLDGEFELTREGSEGVRHIRGAFVTIDGKRRDVFISTTAAQHLYLELSRVLFDNCIPFRRPK